MSDQQATSNVTYNYSGKTVLITGGARGQGLEHAKRFAEAGAAIVIADAGSTATTVPYPLASTDDLEAAVAAVEALGGRCLGEVCDVSDAGQVQALVDKALAEFGAIDILVNNAGIENVTPLIEMRETAWDEMLDTNLKSVFLLSRFVAPTMVERKQGKIINTASTSGFVAAPSQAHYVSAKHGVLGFTKALAIELAEHGITVNAVCPSAVDSPMTDGLWTAHADWITHLGQVVGSTNMVAEGAIPGIDVTNAVLWLASDAARFVTGAALVVDGGYSLK